MFTPYRQYFTHITAAVYLSNYIYLYAFLKTQWPFSFLRICVINESLSLPLIKMAAVSAAGNSALFHAPPVVKMIESQTKSHSAQQKDLL